MPEVDLDTLRALVDQTSTAEGVAPSAPPQELPEGGQKALAFLIRSTSRKPLTTVEARDKLIGREYSAEVADAVVERAVAMKLLDDRAFAAAWVNDRGVNRGYGRRRLERELRRRKLKDEVIEDAIAALDEVDEFAQAVELARKRAQGMPATLEPAKVAGRLLGYLVRRGFASDIAHQVARKVTAMDRDWD